MENGWATCLYPIPIEVQSILKVVLFSWLGFSTSCCRLSLRKGLVWTPSKHLRIRKANPPLIRYKNIEHPLTPWSDLGGGGRGLLALSSCLGIYRSGYLNPWSLNPHHMILCVLGDGYRTSGRVKLRLSQAEHWVSYIDDIGLRIDGWL